MDTWNEGVEREAGDLGILDEAEEETAGHRVPDVEMLVLAARHHSAALSVDLQTGDPPAVAWAISYYLSWEEFHLKKVILC